MSKKKKQKRKQPPRSRDIRIVQPSADLKAVVRLLEEIDDEAHDAARKSLPAVASPLVTFDIAALERGINTLKSVRILVEAGHWEMAHSLLRQLLEFVANMEYLFRTPDREAAMLSYVRYGLLQRTTEQIQTMKYDLSTGRAIDQERLVTLETLRAGSAFEEFKSNTGDGSLKFVSSWSRRHMRALCERSENPMRMSQYELLYSPWSEQVHAAPGALIVSMLRKNDPSWQELVIAEDEVRIHEAVSIAISLFLELRRYLPAINPPDAGNVQDWLVRAKPKRVEVAV